MGDSVFAWNLQHKAQAHHQDVHINSRSLTGDPKSRAAPLKYHERHYYSITTTTTIHSGAVFGSPLPPLSSPSGPRHWKKTTPKLKTSASRPTATGQKHPFERRLSRRFLSRSREKAHESHSNGSFSPSLNGIHLITYHPIDREAWKRAAPSWKDWTVGTG